MLFEKKNVTELTALLSLIQCMVIYGIKLIFLKPHIKDGLTFQVELYQLFPCNGEAKQLVCV